MVGMQTLWPMVSWRLFSYLKYTLKRQRQRQKINSFVQFLPSFPSYCKIYFYNSICSGKCCVAFVFPGDADVSFSKFRKKEVKIYFPGTNMNWNWKFIPLIEIEIIHTNKTVKLVSDGHVHIMLKNSDPICL